MGLLLLPIGAVVPVVHVVAPHVQPQGSGLVVEGSDALVERFHTEKVRGFVG